MLPKKVLLYLTEEMQFISLGMEFVTPYVCETNNTPFKFKNKKSISFPFSYFNVLVASSFWAWLKVYRSKAIAVHLIQEILDQPLVD